MSIKYFLEHLEEIKSMEIKVNTSKEFIINKKNTIICLGRFIYCCQTKLCLDAPTTMAFDSFRRLYEMLKRIKGEDLFIDNLGNMKSIFYYPKDRLLEWIEKIGRGILFNKR